MGLCILTIFSLWIWSKMNMNYKASKSGNIWLKHICNNVMLNTFLFKIDKDNCLFLSNTIPWQFYTTAQIENFQDPKPLKDLRDGKISWAFGAPPPRPLQGLCPGPAGEFTVPPEPQLLWAMTWGMKLMQHMATQNLTRKPDTLHASVVLENFHKLGPDFCFTQS